LSPLSERGFRLERWEESEGFGDFVAVVGNDDIRVKLSATEASCTQSQIAEMAGRYRLSSSNWSSRPDSKSRAALRGQKAAAPQ
jgi:hypothetical protein